MLQNKEQHNAYMAEYMLKRYHTKRDAAKEQFGNICSSCGSSEQLEFDHINPEEKSFNISRMWSFSDSIIQAELEKCQLLCRECHKQKHASSFPCGTAQRYWVGCKCSPCTAANTKHSRGYKKNRWNKRF